MFYLFTVNCLCPLRGNVQESRSPVYLVQVSKTQGLVCRGLSLLSSCSMTCRPVGLELFPESRLWSHFPSILLPSTGRSLGQLLGSNGGKNGAVVHACS